MCASRADVRNRYCYTSSYAGTACSVILGRLPVDLKQLEYFVAVVELGGFSRASRLLGVAQPAISRQVRSLEVELRQNLLLRNGRGAVPTEAGKRLLEHARGILQQVERARLEVDEVKGATVGHVAIGLPPTLARVLTRADRARLPPALSEGDASASSRGCRQRSRSGCRWDRADIGLVYNLDAHAGHRARIRCSRRSCASSDRARGEREAATVRRCASCPRYPLIMPARPNAIRTLVESRLATKGLRPHVTLEVDAISAIVDLVAEGLGYAILSRRALPEGAAPGALTARPIVRPTLKSALAIAVSAQRPATPLQKACVELVAALVPKVFASR